MKRTLILLVLVILLALPAVPALAQSQNPPVDPNSAWGEVVDSNGNILYSNLTDLGPVQKSASWMPGIPGIGNLQASYHEYQTPSGNIVVMPTATTLFFMALNPQASGMAQAASQLGMGAGMELEALFACLVALVGAWGTFKMPRWIRCPACGWKHPVDGRETP